MRRRAKLARLPTLLCALAIAACGGSESPEPAPEPTPEPQPTPAPKETTDKLPQLPELWQPHENRAGGFAFGLPPGWEANDRRPEPGARRTTTLVRSFDRLVALSIVPDRSPETLDQPLDELAVATAPTLPGVRGKPGNPHPFKQRYRATEVRAEAKTRDGLEQRLSVIVLRRDRMVTFTVAIAANNEADSEPSAELADQLVSTLRSRPPRGRKK